MQCKKTQHFNYLQIKLPQTLVVCKCWQELDPNHVAGAPRLLPPVMDTHGEACDSSPRSQHWNRVQLTFQLWFPIISFAPFVAQFCVLGTSPLSKQKGDYEWATAALRSWARKFCYVSNWIFGSSKKKWCEAKPTQKWFLHMNCHVSNVFFREPQSYWFHLFSSVYCFLREPSVSYQTLGWCILYLAVLCDIFHYFRMPTWDLW